MKNIIILIPVYNDWESLNKLILQISDQVGTLKGYQFKFVIINDGSTSPKPKINFPENIDSIKLLNMKTNKGHMTCIAYGINYVKQKEKFDNLILMDGDGEDRPEELLSLIKKNLEFQNKSVVAKRVKRSEGTLFKNLYELHKCLTLLFTGKKINFGNFSLLTKEDLFLISDKKNLWGSYSGTFKKNIKNYKEINSIRGIRYFGPSKMSIFKLIFHSFSIIATFKYNVLFRSTLIIIILAYLNSYLGNLAILFQIIIVIFNLIIFAISKEKNKNDFNESHKNLESDEKITH